MPTTIDTAFLDTMPPNVAVQFFDRVAATPDAEAFRFPRGEAWESVTWKQAGGLPDVTRSFHDFWEAAEEAAMARIYGGVHYRFDQEAGHQVGRSVAEFVFANLMTPRRR